MTAHGGRPLAVLISGAPGSGKSTAGALLARELRAAVLDLDTASASLVSVLSGLTGTDDLDDPELARLTRAARYESITRLAEDNLATGISVVLVAPFTAERRDPQDWLVLQRRLQDAGARPVLVWLRIPADAARRRVEDRAAGRDVAKLVGHWPPAADLAAPAVPHIDVDALQSPADVVAQILARLPRERED